METSRKRKVRELYDRIDELNRRLSEADKGERAKIKGQLMTLRRDVARALEPEAKEGRLGASPAAAKRIHIVRPGPEDRSVESSAVPPKISKPSQAPDRPQKLEGSPHPARSEPERSRSQAPRPTRPEPSRSSAGRGVSTVLVRDYVYKRLKELGQIILSGEGAEREEAKKERSFLEGQLEIANRKGQRKADFDPALVILMREGRSPTLRSGPEKAIGNRPKEVPASPIEQPVYWDKCTKMDFRRLREFIDDSLQERAWHRFEDGRPRSKEEFLALWEMLRGKINAENMPDILPVPIEPAEFPQFAPSEYLGSLLDQREQLAQTLNAALGNPSATKRSINKLRRKLRFLEPDISLLESRERQEHAERREAYLRPYLEAMAARERSIRQRNAQQLKTVPLRRRIHFTETTRKDIERAFEVRPTPQAKRLGWRVLPPGELSADAVRRHYDTLQRTNPDVRYERERITKALSLRPNEYYVGMDEFEGYIVLTFARTPRVLMECPVFGNAIYVIKSDWKRLSRMSKRALLAQRSDQVTKIVHKGDWFRRVKLELGIR
ncbi:MAG: hypothetical protein M3R38_13825 [Actinomycetota bacterium]|nr:hypothetical protein [Actinomycetota bacterium]